MASIKNANTLDREQGEKVRKRDTIASLRADLAEARKERDFFRANSLRKEGVITMLQKKVARLEGGKPQRPTRPAQEDLDAYFEANPEARSVSPDDLAAFIAAR